MQSSKPEPTFSTFSTLRSYTQLKAHIFAIPLTLDSRSDTLQVATCTAPLYHVPFPPSSSSTYTRYSSMQARYSAIHQSSPPTTQFPSSYSTTAGAERPLYSVHGVYYFPPSQNTYHLVLPLPSTIVHRTSFIVHHPALPCTTYL